MQSLSILSKGGVEFCDYSTSDPVELESDFWDLTFDGRHDFLINSEFAGIAVRIHFINEKSLLDRPRGVRRRVRFTVIDTTMRTEVFARSLSVCIGSNTYSEFYYLNIPVADAQIAAGHNYNLFIYDETGKVRLGEYAFHLYDEGALGSPGEWYRVCRGGVRPEWSKELRRSLYAGAESYDTHYVVFQLEHRFGVRPPVILPELEMRLYGPEGKRINTLFVAPMPEGNGPWSGLFVEQPFSTSEDDFGVYYAELLCMGLPIAGCMFKTQQSVGTDGAWRHDELDPLAEYSIEAAEARFDELIKPYRGWSDDSEEMNSEPEQGTGPEVEEASESPAEEPAAEADVSMEQLVGLKAVKEKLTVYKSIVQFNRMRMDNGLPVDAVPLHSMFLGSPGTGKTTVAKMMGAMLRRAGMLSKGHVVVRERSTLLGKFYNSEAENTLGAIEEAQGGILFIDEAYQLYQPEDTRDPGRFVIETLLTALADPGKRDWMLILAGYPDEMRRMFEMNPGLKSRIPESNIYMFEDFSEPELMEIAEGYLSRNRYVLRPDARSVLAQRLRDDYSRRDMNFGNARHVMNIIQTEIFPAMAVRVTAGGEITPESLSEILPCDIPVRHREERKILRPRIGYAV